MEPKSLLARLEPPFVRLGVLGGMADVATRLATAGKALEEIREFEDLLLRKEYGFLDTSRAMRDISALASMAAKAAGEAVGILRGMKPGVVAYMAEVRDAID